MSDLNPFRYVNEALEALQTTFRTNGLQQLAVLTPTRPIQDESEFQFVRIRLTTLMKLMTLNPPRTAALKKVTASLERAVKAISAVEQETR